MGIWRMCVDNGQNVETDNDEGVDIEILKEDAAEEARSQAWVHDWRKGDLPMAKNVTYTDVEHGGVLPHETEEVAGGKGELE